MKISITVYEELKNIVTNVTYGLTNVTLAIFTYLRSLEAVFSI
jgi:hypothetical protein